jgi:hypothetical protein
MATFPTLPGWIGQLESWSASAHYLDFEVKEGEIRSAFEALVIAKEDSGGTARLQRIQIFAPGGIGLPKPGSEEGLKTAPSEWLRKVIPELGMPLAASSTSDPIDARGIATHFTPSTARNLLTGHLLALRFFEILKARHALKSEQVFLTESVKVSLPKKEGENITQTTARIHEELQLWGETTSAWIIKELEGVSINTIYNRLNVARSKNIIERPGTGARKKK